MPTVLQINTTLNTGSTGRIAEQIAILAQKDGWNCYIAHGARYVGTSVIKSIQIGTLLGNYIHAFLGEFLGLHGFGSKIATFLFLRKLNKIKPDIIHLHNIHGYYLNIELLFKYIIKNQIPVVWTLHDCWSFTGHCTHFELAGCEKWKTECGACPLLMAQYKSRFIDRTQSNFKVKKELYSNVNKMIIVPVSFWLSNLVSQSILKKHPIHVITNGIDLGIFKYFQSNLRKTLGIRDNEIFVLGVVASGFGIEKGRNEFISISKEHNIKVVIVGLSNKDKKGLPNSIICVDRTNNQRQLAEYYSAADVFVNPTYNDTLPTTNIEAIACGTPVVTYNTGGSPEIMSNRTGAVVNKGDLDSLLHAIEEVKKRGKDFYGKECRKRAVEYYNKDERFADYIKLYREIVNHN